MSHITVHREAGWNHIVLDRPEKRNALSMDLLTELKDALLEADADETVHATMISANGPDFCSGFDLLDERVESHAEDPMLQAASLSRGREVMRLIPQLLKPVVAKVHGRCWAGGTELALVCDLVYATTDADFAYPPVRDMGTPAVPMWVYHVGPQWARRLLFTGDSIKGAEAAKIGLVLKALPADELDREVEGLMRRLTKIDWQLLAVQKRIVSTSIELMGASALFRSAELLDAVGLLAPTSKKIRESSPDELVQIYKTRRQDLFGPGAVSVDGPDDFDDEGRLN